jgi:hypothetical protein
MQLEIAQFTAKVYTMGSFGCSRDSSRVLCVDCVSDADRNRAHAAPCRD